MRSIFNTCMFLMCVLSFLGTLFNNILIDMCIYSVHVSVNYTKFILLIKSLTCFGARNMTV